ncbi:hypothetical protein K504DRAFT_494575 [Pleomassaria siparia CBS 279.74]|uniref:Mediator of RNA polymerase II transcription subunit 18 n=1 Tax=Pleomassaria siparia CBS 279.74 TaxID=1314801 RepID=A0A6G1JVY1_9PLEO|nr:hypothetical protein K504DRAFT_494575 [Pleomassaria siparia CBS 279.74]
MHELLLYGQVPLSRHEQVLKVLAGVAAMQPRRILQRHIIYKPDREPEEAGLNRPRGGTQTIAVKQTKQVGSKDLNYCQLIQQLSEDEFGNPSKGPPVHGGGAGAEAKWTLVFNDTPDTGDRGVLTRLSQNTDIISGDPHAYMVAARHQFVSEYYIEGHRFVHENVVILLHRVLHEPGVRSLATAPKDDLPAFSSLQPLDSSGGYILETKIRVQDLNHPAVLEAGVSELKRFQTQMKGCVELSEPERLALDTRVKYKPQTT